MSEGGTITFLCSRCPLDGPVGDISVGAALARSPVTRVVCKVSKKNVIVIFQRNFDKNIIFFYFL